MTLMLIDSCSCLSFSRLPRAGGKKTSKKQLSLNYKIKIRMHVYAYMYNIYEEKALTKFNSQKMGKERTYLHIGLPLKLIR